jgi:hypothetical protein
LQRKVRVGYPWPSPLQILQDVLACRPFHHELVSAVIIS